MRAVVMSLLLAVGVALAGGTSAEARERRAAPIEYARRGERPADVGPVRPVAPASAAPRRAAPAPLDFPDMLYGYGRASTRDERPALDLRGRLGGGSGGALLEDAAFDEAPAAAAQLPDAEGETVAPVAVVVVSPVEVNGEAPAASASTPLRDAYFVQVGAFADPANADRARATLDDVGQVTIDRRETASATLHRVRLGQWATRQEAELVLSKVAARGFTGALVAGGP